jgi:hypothetical protein
MPRLFHASLALAVLLTSSGFAGEFGGFRTRVEPLRSTRPSFAGAEVRVADLGTRVDT